MEQAQKQQNRRLYCTEPALVRALLCRGGGKVRCRNIRGHLERRTGILARFGLWEVGSPAASTIWLYSQRFTSEEYHGGAT